MRTADTLQGGRGSLARAHRGRRWPGSLMLDASLSYYMSGLPDTHVEGFGGGLVNKQEA